MLRRGSGGIYGRNPVPPDDVPAPACPGIEYMREKENAEI